ncbi:hypothetical protein BFJ63_vAg7391 [Fusarium oxysporum f. sp. narcissi]|uniref:Uncharacterized protein n=2 Tax=Fusarium oxysporum TaxID=5507 RepID=A0A4Q2VSU3_FUSOX|nr:hypothetical protein FOWG_14116 [Fusarium oxysporum f. sp. lycopersici MN25]KAJ4121757.1 hypothetical protein NW765_004582 [Fusarium oxysporum]RKK24330.1 hypothetical protein BFJ65_g2274 [Fusarium oxysporum f. sp. cepae]RYC89733.1 hypothetical protein BFJ63_vAg7391 [Fusarium oxysporum f. sp. narcissi]KAJ4275141.1 hypothetical protein NW764_010651 [Fusarium oxysporum]
MSSESQPTAEVTGPTAFWILASLASAAAAQPSGNRKRDNDLFGGNVDIVRSIPAVCLIDSIFDLFVLAGGISRFLSSHNSTQQTRRNSPKATGLVIRLALTIFTVLPQTIKVFSLQGVPATQICAFIFFFANITKLLVSICGWEPEGILQEKDDSTSIDVLLSSVLQAPFEFWIWFNISRQASFKLSTALENLCEWAAMVVTFSMVLQVVIWIAYLVARRRLDLSRSLYIVPMRGFYLVMVVLGLARQPSARNPSQATIKPPPRWMDVFNYSSGLIICTAIVSIAIAKLLESIGTLLALLLSRDSSEDEQSGQSEVQSTSGEDTAEEQDETREQMFAGHPGAWLGRIGVAPDQLVVRGLTLNTTASTSITLTLFNLITTVFYYLVYFDGTGTENPSWTSVLG